jgi:hypothetical protein
MGQELVDTDGMAVLRSSPTLAHNQLLDTTLAHSGLPATSGHNLSQFW